MRQWLSALIECEHTVKSTDEADGLRTAIFSHSMGQNTSGKAAIGIAFDGASGEWFIAGKRMQVEPNAFQVNGCHHHFILFDPAGKRSRLAQAAKDPGINQSWVQGRVLRPGLCWPWCNRQNGQRRKESQTGLPRVGPHSGQTLAFRDPRTSISFYVESDGRHLAAIDRDGKLLWVRNPYEDKPAFCPRFTPRPVIQRIEAPKFTDAGEKAIKAAGGNLDHEFLYLAFDSMQDGVVDETTRDFIPLGQNWWGDYGFSRTPIEQMRMWSICKAILHWGPLRSAEHALAVASDATGSSRPSRDIGDNEITATKPSLRTSWETGFRRPNRRETYPFGDSNRAGMPGEFRNQVTHLSSLNAPAINMRSVFFSS
jgi:hypothetical protein